MQEEIIFAGFGGQGVLLQGSLSRIPRWPKTSM